MGILLERLDAFVNAVTGLGAEGSKGRATSFVGSSAPTAKTLDALFVDDWLAKRIVTAPVDDALAKGFLVGEDPASPEYAEWRSWNYTDRYPAGIYQAAAYEGRLHGGAALIAGFGSDPSKPLPATPGPLKWLEVYNRHEISILRRYSDANSDLFGDPELIEVGSGSRQGMRVHTSRVLWFEGDPPGVRRQRDELEGFWHESVLRAPMRALERYGYSWEAVSHMLQEADLTVLTISGLIEAIATDNGTAFLDRLRLMNRAKGINGMVLLDAQNSEKIERHSTNFAGITDILDRSAQEISGAARIPQTRLFGRSPAGMNATGESDLATYYDELAVVQERSHREKLEVLLMWITGKDVEVSFPSLWQQSDLEIEQERKERFTADKLLQDLGVDGLEIVAARASDGTLGVDLPPAAYELEDEPPPPFPEENMLHGPETQNESLEAGEATKGTSPPAGTPVSGADSADA